MIRTILTDRQWALMDPHCLGKHRSDGVASRSSPVLIGIGPSGIPRLRFCARTMSRISRSNWSCHVARLIRIKSRLMR